MRMYTVVNRFSIQNKVVGYRTLAYYEFFALIQFSLYFRTNEYNMHLEIILCSISKRESRFYFSYTMIF